MDEDLLNGDGSAADALNGSDMGAIYEGNQSGFDVADNGQVSSTGVSTTVQAPSWQDSLSGLFGLAGKAAATIAPFVGNTTAPQSKVATPSAGVLGAVGSSRWTMVALGIGGLLAAFLFLRKK